MNGRPAWLLAALVAALCVPLAVSFRIYEKDFWQHLAVGRAIWTRCRPSIAAGKLCYSLSRETS